MDLKRLRYFCAIVEHGQISKAAAALNMAQPPLSLRLKELEEEFGVRLIIRGQRRLKMTEEGRLLYDRAKLILSEVDALSEEMKANQDTPVWLVVGTSSTCASYLRKPLSTLYTKTSNVKLRVMLGDSDWLTTMVDQRLLDFAVMQPPTGNSSYHIDELPCTPCTVVVPEHLAKPEWGETLHMEDIAPYPLILLRRPSGTGSYERFVTWFHTRNIPFHVSMDCPDVRVIKELWNPEGDGIAILPQSEIRDFRPAGGVLYTLNEPDMDFHPAIIRPKGVSKSSNGKNGNVVNDVIEMILKNAA